MQDEILASLLKRGRHGKDWGDANAACNQDGFGRTLNKREVILRQVDFNGIGEALARMETRDVFGKILLKVG